MDCGSPSSSIYGISQGRILEWVAMPSSRGSSWPRDWTHISYASCIGRWVLYHSHHLGSLYLNEWLKTTVLVTEAPHWGRGPLIKKGLPSWTATWSRNKILLCLSHSYIALAGTFFSPLWHWLASAGGMRLQQNCIGVSGMVLLRCLVFPHSGSRRADRPLPWWWLRAPRASVPRARKWKP